MLPLSSLVLNGTVNPGFDHLVKQKSRPPSMSFQAMQVERVSGFREYIDDVKSGQFPGPKHIVNAPEGLIDQFLSAVDGNKDS